MLKSITSSTRYIKMKEIKAGDVLIKEGTFMEVRPGKFGDTYIFQEKDGEEVGLGASGQIKSLYTRNKLRIGCKYQITFNGKVSLKDGRTANDFGVGEYVNEAGEEDFISDSDFSPEEEA